MKQLKFAYLSSQDPRNKKVWSGTHYSIYKTLCSIGEVDILGPFEPNKKIFILRLINQLYLKIFKKRVSYRHSISVSKGYADYFNQKLNSGKYDYIIAPAASTEIAFIETKTPIIYITDGTFAGCQNYHKSLSHLTKKSMREGNLVEQNAIDKSKFVIVSSEWAAKSIITDYHAKKEKVHIIPFGANLENISEFTSIDSLIPKIWKLLFVGVYWEDKGGEIAYNCFKILKDKGFDVELTIVGCTPPAKILGEKVKVIPFIDKNEAEGQKKLAEIFSQHHFLLLPTRFDCTPIVINEASAFGIPTIAARTGGVEGHLKSGINGFLADYTDTGRQYALHIEKMINSPESYLKLRKSTKAYYAEKLNWENWKREFIKLLGIIS